jgi:hypothetical protein
MSWDEALADDHETRSANFDTLHAYFLDRLLPVCTQLLGQVAGDRL